MRWQPKHRRGKSGGYYGTRNGREHPFAEETRGLLKSLAHHHSYVCYSSPDSEDRPNVDFDAAGHLNMQALQELDLPRNGDFYICGPSTFMSDLTAGLAALGVAPCSDPHRDCSEPAHPLRQALRLRRAGRRICRQGPPGQDRWFRLPVAASMSAGGHRFKACSNWLRLATYPCDLRVEPASATPARADLWQGPSAIGRIRSMHRRKAMC